MTELGFTFPLKRLSKQRLIPEPQRRALPGASAKVPERCPGRAQSAARGGASARGGCQSHPPLCVGLVWTGLERH